MFYQLFYEAYYIVCNKIINEIKTSVACLIFRFGNTYGYGFAFGLRSPYTPLFNMELFRLQNDFIISSLTHKWTKDRVKCELVDNFEEQQQNGKICFHF